MGQKVNPLGFRLGVSQKHISHWFIENHNYSQLVVEDTFIRNFFSKKFPGIASINIKRDLNRIVIEILSANTRDLLMEGGKMTAKATLLPLPERNSGEGPRSDKGETNRAGGSRSSGAQSAANPGAYPIDSLCDQLLKELTIYRNARSPKNKLNKLKSLRSEAVQHKSNRDTFSEPISGYKAKDLSSTNSNISSEFNPQIESGITAKPVEVELFLTKVENPNTSAACLAEFIVEQLEKRVPFRRVLKRSIQKAEEASVEGIKVQISGRLNGAEIARSERIHKGQVPLHTLRAKIEYNSRTAKTIYGLLGVKVWVFNGFADLNEAKFLNKH